MKYLNQLYYKLELVKTKILMNIFGIVNRLDLGLIQMKNYCS